MLGRHDLDNLYRAQGERLLALAFQMTGDRALAADVLQEVFARAWKHRKTFREEAEASTWLYRITIRESIRARSRRRARAIREHRVDPARSRDGNPSQVEDRERLYQALDELSDDHRAVLTLLTLRGLTAERVGEILGIPANTVYSRAAAARRALRSAMQE